MSYNKRYEIISDYLLRVYEYEKPIKKGYHIERDKYRFDLSHKKQDKNLSRVRCNLKNTIDCNVCKYSKFISLTFKEDIKDRDTALYYLRLFRKNWLRYYKTPLKYVGVMELQNGSERHGKTKEEARNVWHFHLIVFNDFKIDFEVFNSKIWKYGISEIKKVDNVNNLGRYLMKYITKDFIEVDFYKNMILKSQNLKKPKILYKNDNTLSLDISQTLERIKKSCISYQNEYNFIIPELLDKKTGLIKEKEIVNVKMIEYTTLAATKL